MMNIGINLARYNKKLLCIIFFGPLLSVFTIQNNYGQNLPKVFVEDLSNAMRSVIVSGYDSLDMYTVVVKISPNGVLEKTFISQGASQTMKEIIGERLAIVQINHVPLREYWKKYCIENKISRSTIIIQTVFTRSKQTDSLHIDINQLTKKYQQALSFLDGNSTTFGEGIVIWFPIKLARFDNDIHVD